MLVLAVAALATAIGVAVLWPSYEEPTVDPTYAWSAGTSVVTESAEVVSTDVGPCGSPDNGRVLPGPPLEPRFPGPECSRSIVWWSRLRERSATAWPSVCPVTSGTAV